MFSASAFMGKFLRQIRRMDVVIILVLLIAYIATRLTNLLALPIFSDEGIYINWARIAAHDPAWRFISLIDGKQPLQTWGTIPFIKLFPYDLLLAGRLFAVASGIFALAGMVTLTWYLWGRKAGYLAGALYVVSPYFLFYDRIALVDSAVNAGIIWILFFSILLVRTFRLDVAILFGVVSGIGLLAKSSTLLFVALSGLALIFVPGNKVTFLSLREIVKDISNKHAKYFDFLVLFAVSVSVALSLYLTQKFFSPFFHYIAQKNLTFILSPSEWIAHPFGLVPNNIRLVIEYVAWESGWIPVVLAFLGYRILFKQDRRLAIYLALWIFIPFVMIVNFNKVIFPRYLIFFPSFLTILSVYFIAHLKSKREMMVSIVVTIVILLGISAPMLFSVRHISLPPVDRGQYIIGKTAVWGAQDLMEKVRLSTKDGKRALILAEGNFGLIADVLTTIVRPDDSIDIRGLWPLNEEHILDAQKELTNYHVYVVFSHRTDFPVHWRDVMTLIETYYKPADVPDAVYLYQLKESEN